MEQTSHFLLKMVRRENHSLRWILACEEIVMFREVDKEIEEELTEMEQESDVKNGDDQNTGELSAII